MADLQWEFSVAKDAQWLTLTLKRMEMAEVTRLRALLYPKSEPTKIVRTAHTAHVAFVPRLARRLEMSKFAQPGQSGIPAKPHTDRQPGGGGRCGCCGVNGMEDVPGNSVHQL